MSFTVIWFKANGFIGQEYFRTQEGAEMFDEMCLSRGHTTSGVLGDDDNWLNDE